MQTSSTWKNISKNMRNLNMTLLFFPPINRLEITLFSLLCPWLLPFLLLSPCEWSPACVIVWDLKNKKRYLCCPLLVHDCNRSSRAKDVTKLQREMKYDLNRGTLWLISKSPFLQPTKSKNQWAWRVAFQCVAAMQELQWSYFQLVWRFAPYFFFHTRSINVPVRER